MAHKAIIAGASGLIGSNLLQLLLESTAYSEVLVLVRKEVPVQHKKLVQAIINFDELDHHESFINGHAVFSCLGTTNSQTRDKALYKKIDHDYPVQLAQIATKNGVRQFHLISSIGANVNASGFYLKTKGETEHDVEKAGINTLHIYQPSFLEGRTDNQRPLENFLSIAFKIINPLLTGRLKKYRSIPAKTVARAMLNKSLTNEEGIFIHPSDKIQELA